LAQAGIAGWVLIAIVVAAIFGIGMVALVAVVAIQFLMSML